MHRWLRVIVWVLVLGAVLVTVAGPWPVRTSTTINSARYMQDNLETIAASATVGPLFAGWSTEPLVPPEGTPLAGYGDRRGRPAEGTRDQLEVGAIAFGHSTGATAVIVGTDLLVVTENVAAGVRARLAANGIDLPILFSASHTHSGPGAAMRGLVARAFGGKYNRDVERTIVETIVAAVSGSLEDLRPVTMETASIEVPEFIRNRTRDSTVEAALVDPFLDAVRVVREDGESCTLVRYSAHATVIGSQNMLFSGGYPAALREATEQRLGGTAIFLAGAVGSMGPRAPEADDDFSRANLMGEALGSHLAGPVWQPVNVTALGVCDVEITAPPIQLRLRPRFRVSPLLLAMNGVNRSGRMTAIAFGDVVLIGFPFDLSGEISMSIRAWGRQQGLTVVPLSFSGDYLGYVSPDEYYGELRDESGLAYETGIMSWLGPAQEQFTVTMAQAIVSAVVPSPVQ